ncbi:ABC transporter permease [Couchioplanes caeruleus]|uniref:ABC transporter permease n=1 Tax=Couchioplanes caeruleus TaxID=56438 RepID=UPI0020C134F2|nr:ABC transporter permease [Couchioplanes caeruleus]UQU61293.1 ABC transporter permease [Couchioplanes caeruleus]
MTAVQNATTGPAGVAPGDDRGRTVEKVSLARLTRVELRKLADTRAGLWLLIVIGLAAAGTAAILLGAAPDEEQTYQGFLSFGLAPATVLLPVLGILSMTSEWSQRTALTTFTLTPARGRVVAAKLIAAVLIAVAATAAAALLSAGANLIALGTGGDGSWHLTADQAGRLLVNQVMFVLMGAGFGALLMSPALAIVLYFALPTAWSALGQMVKRLNDAAGWLDLNVTSLPLSEPAMSSGQWARLGVSCAVWVILPLAAGTVRVLRREVS